MCLTSSPLDTGRVVGTTESLMEQNGTLGYGFFVLFCFFIFLGPYLWHMEVPRLGV